METLDPRVRIVWVVAGLSTAFFLGGGVTVGLFFFAPDWVLAGPAVVVGLVALGVVFSVLRFRRWRYEVQADALFIERGVLTQVRTVVPYVRLQHVDTRRSPTERAVGLASVVVYTAGSRSADVSIPGLTPERADRLQTRLRELAIESEPEDAV
jgi:membrane protein YdbS with pleckstrin-like domain